METILQDVRYGLRLLGRQRGFTVLAIVTLALGIGLSTALVSVIDAAILHPLPYAHPEQLVEVFIDSPQSDGRTARMGPSIERARTMMAAGHVFSDIAVSRNIFTPLVTDDVQPERLRGMEITEGYLPLFGVKPLLGRGIGADDTRPGAPAVVLLGFDYWQRRYAGNRDVVGQTIRFDAGPATIVGVLPSTFSRRTPIWRPLVITPFLLGRDGTGTETDARLRPGVTPDRAARELTDLIVHTDKRGAPTVAMQSLLASERRGKQIVRTLAWAVGLILLIACVNVGGLLLARGSTRLPELAIRRAIGAGRLRLVRQLMTESLLLAVAGGIAGILTAWWSLDGLVAMIPMSLPSNSPAAINIRVLAFSLGLSLVTGISFGLTPALSLSRVRVTNGLARGTRGAASQLSRRSGQILIGLEVALAVVLLAGAGLMVSSFARLLAADLGFNPDAFVTVEVQTVDSSPATISQFYPQLIDRIRTLPGVAAVGAINDLPLKHSATHMSAQLDNGASAEAVIRQVLPGYFEAIGLQLHQGRFPTDADRASGRPVLVLSEEAARHYFPDGAPVGRQVQIGKLDMEVIGVVSDVRANGAVEPLMNEVYVLLSRGEKEPGTPRAMVVVVRPRSNDKALIDQLRQTAASIGPRVIIDRVSNGRVWLDDDVITPRRRTALLSVLGGLGLLLALVAVFGMTAYAVARRTQETGVRMAFGATPGDVVREMVIDAAIPVAAGIFIGLGAAALATRVIASFLFNTTPTDPTTFASVAATIGLTAGVAAWIPARRAARVDPVKALRAE